MWHIKKFEDSIQIFTKELKYIFIYWREIAEVEISVLRDF